MEPQTLHVLVYDQEQPPRTRLYSTPLHTLTEGTLHDIKAPKTFIKSIIMDLKRAACMQNVGDGYVTDAITENTHIFILFSSDDDGAEGEPYGFILSRRDSEGFYIDVICAEKYGAQLLNYFIQFTTAAGARGISLNALPNVLSYYPRFGFKFRKSCDNKVLITLPPEIPALLKELKSTGQPLPRTAENVYEYPEYTDFLLNLQEKGFGVKKSKYCKKPWVTVDTILEHDCDADGYSMLRCADNVEPNKPVRTRKRRHVRRSSTRRNTLP